jgi:hypothetical protein
LLALKKAPLYTVIVSPIETHEAQKEESTKTLECSGYEMIKSLGPILRVAVVGLVGTIILAVLLRSLAIVICVGGQIVKIIIIELGSYLLELLKYTQSASDVIQIVLTTI